jgi:sulfur relay (sulfurtransferase) complex TusBCD TusD component (DsrE family)
MNLGIVIYSHDPETVWNAFRIANFALKLGDGVEVFLIGKGVEAELVDVVEDFHIREQMVDFLAGNGRIYACGTCLLLRNLKLSPLIRVATLSDLYEIIRNADKVLTF